MIATIYSAETGEVIGRLSGRRLKPEALERGGLAFIEGAVPAGSYIDPGTKAPLPLRTFDVAIENNRVTGIPAGSRALIKAAQHAVDDGEILFAVDHPETLRVLLTHPHFQTLELEVACAPNQD